MHAKGSKIFLQLWTPGRAADPEVLKSEEAGPYDVVGPSAVPMVEGGVVPRALSEKEVGEYVKWFAEAAKRFVGGAGGDGVESKLATACLSLRHRLTILPLAHSPAPSPRRQRLPSRPVSPDHRQ